MNRLSPFNITDPLIMASLFREWRNGSREWDEYEVSLDECAMPEKVAFRYHGTPATKLTISVCAGQDDLRETIKPGTVAALPGNSEIRERIRHYQRLEERLKVLNG